MVPDSMARVEPGNLHDGGPGPIALERMTIRDLISELTSIQDGRRRHGARAPGGVVAEPVCPHRLAEREAQLCAELHRRRAAPVALTARALGGVAP